MARLTALALRDRARAAVLAAGGRGFVRFLPAGGALLATDAIRRCADAAAQQRLAGALEEAGFACRACCGLLELTPRDGVLDALCGDAAGAIDWGDPLHPAQALARRWLAEQRTAWTDAGRQLTMDALRLVWRPRAQVLAGLAALRAQAAVMLRSGDRSGFRAAGAVLNDWCMQERGGCEDEAGVDRACVLSPDGGRRHDGDHGPLRRERGHRDGSA